MTRNIVLALGLIVALPLASEATSISFSGSSGSLAANVVFSQAAPGANLIITLTNTSTADTLVPANVLTGVFFDINGTPTLTRVSGVLAAGSTVFDDPDGQPAGGAVGGEFAYKAGLAGTPYSATRGISSSGLGLFGPGDLFPGADLAPPASPDGVQYGLVSANDNTATGNGGLLAGEGLIKNSVVFTLGVPTGYELTSVSKVSFQYGTNLSEPNVPGTPDEPEPLPEGGSTAMLIGIALIALAVGRRALS